MGNSVIGFVGSDKYELILYLSRILLHLGKKVLLVDYAKSQALYHCIPIPETLCEESGYIDYRGTDFIQGQNYDFSLGSQYDVVLMDFGFEDNNEGFSYCTKVLYVTDLQLHNIQRIKNLYYLEKAEKYLVIKDVFQCKIKPEFILNQLHQVIDKDHVYVLFQDAMDLKHKIQSQYSHRVKFRKLSSPTKYFLKEITKQVDHSLDDKHINNAYKKAERGN